MKIEEQESEFIRNLAANIYRDILVNKKHVMLKTEDGDYYSPDGNDPEDLAIVTEDAIHAAVIFTKSYKKIMNNL